MEGTIDTNSIDNGLRKTKVYRHGTKEYLDMTDSEVRAYAEHIRTVIPREVAFDINGNIYKQLRDGVVLTHFLNHLKKDLISLRSITTNVDMEKQNGVFEASTNLANVLRCAKRIGVVTVNIGPEDILYENRVLILGLLWQLVKMSVTNVSKIMDRPELVNLLKDSENLFDITTGNPEDILLRWINYHLENAHKSEYVANLKNLIIYKVEGQHEDFMAHVPKKCTNFGADLRDSKIYLLVLKQVAGSHITDEAFLKAYIEQDNFKRAENVIKFAEELDCKKFITSEAITMGDTRLNFLFMATIFNTYIGLSKSTSNDVESMRSQIDSLQQEKEKMAEKIKRLQERLENYSDEGKQINDLKKLHEDNIEARKEIYNKALVEHNKTLEDFSNDILMYSDKLGYVYNNEENLSPKDKIMFTVNALTNELEKLRIDNRDLRQMNIIINEIYMKLEKKIEEHIADKKPARKGCLDIFFCK
ncbi:Plastin-1 [Nosema granulosis]|uniref:Plastin-1 n=1 Tax=Nosema granulosis TaxID=83296 RepID=A0A9P6H118_9MICR|nr:Plastin-1 [Nosema granulosis]